MYIQFNHPMYPINNSTSWSVLDTGITNTPMHAMHQNNLHMVLQQGCMHVVVCKVQGGVDGAVEGDIDQDAVKLWDTVFTIPLTVCKVG